YTTTLNKADISAVIKDKTAILVDDVLYTGRTVRAAMSIGIALKSQYNFQVEEIRIDIWLCICSRCLCYRYSLGRSCDFWKFPCTQKNIQERMYSCLVALMAIIAPFVFLASPFKQRKG